MRSAKKGQLHLTENIKEIIGAAILLYVLWLIIKLLYLGG